MIGGLVATFPFRRQPPPALGLALVAVLVFAVFALEVLAFEALFLVSWGMVDVVRYRVSTEVISM